MAYFTGIGLNVLILLLWTSEAIEPEQSKHEYSVVAKVLQKFFDTYNAYSKNVLALRADDKGTKLADSVDKVIKLKVQALKPYLEDNSTITEQGDTNDKGGDEINVALEGDEETTIIEFIPTQDDNTKQALRIREERPGFKDNVQKYKKIRDQIKNILIEESVSVKSQKLVVSTLDSMLAYMVRSQCPTNGESNDLYRERLRAADDMVENKDLTKNWTKKWNEIREKYNKIWVDHFPKQPNPARKLFMFFEQIQDFLTTIINDTSYITNNYKVVCKLVRFNDKEVLNFNDDNLLTFRTGKSKKLSKCPNFKVCSDELERFMKRFYKKLNDTIDHTFQNYAAMYVSDITSDGSGEKETVIATINRSGTAALHKVKKIFKSLTTAFDLDHNKSPEENMKRLKTYVHDVIENSLASIKIALSKNTMDDSIKERLITNVNQDLSANIDVDLGNLRSEAKKEMCRDFSSCNGQLIIRKIDDAMGTRRNMGPIDKNKVYVKLQLTLDKDLKQKIAKDGIDYFDNLMRKDSVRSRSSKIDKIVTRTTLRHLVRSHNKTRTTKQAVSKMVSSKKVSGKKVSRKKDSSKKHSRKNKTEKITTPSSKRTTHKDVKSKDPSSIEKGSKESSSKEKATPSNIRDKENEISSSGTSSSESTSEESSTAEKTKQSHNKKTHKKKSRKRKEKQQHASVTRLDRDAIVSEISTEI